MSCIKREDVRSKQVELVKCELDGDRYVMVGAISPSEFLDLSDEVIQDGEITSKGLFMVALARMSARDDEGVLLFNTNSEVEGTLSIGDIAKVSEMATTVSGLNEVDAKKNLTDGDSLPTG